MSEIRVLVVDDHDLFRVGLASLLAAVDGIDVVGQASSGAPAVRLAGEVQPDVVLLALSLPDGGASAATRQIVAEHAGVRVIVLAGGEAESDIRAALRAGACGYLHKEDMPLEEIVAAIRAAASGGTWQAPRASQSRREGLTPRELEVLELLRRGLATTSIAAKLDISPVAVRSVISRIVHKTDPPSGWFRQPRGPGPEGSGGVREPRRPQPETGGGSARLQPPTNVETGVWCSFWGKDQASVRALIAGPDVCICNECVELCVEIVAEEPQEPRGDGPPEP